MVRGVPKPVTGGGPEYDPSSLGCTQFSGRPYPVGPPKPLSSGIAWAAPAPRAQDSDSATIGARRAGDKRYDMIDPYNNPSPRASPRAR